MTATDASANPESKVNDVLIDAAGTSDDAVRAKDGAKPAGYLRSMVRRPAPEDACVVAGSTPVVSFGDPGRAEVATLGINPSKAEFLAGGELLVGADRRLATLDSLGAELTTQLSDEQIEDVLADCAAYFDTNPYWRWFTPLNEVIEAGLGVSYLAGTACHLDLVQWATDPVWGQISSVSARQQLLDEGAEFLEQQLRTESIETVVVNGKGVWDQLRSSGLAEFADVGAIEVNGKVKTTLRIGEGCGARFVGWTLNLQSSHGVRVEDRTALAEWLHCVVGERSVPSDFDFSPQLRELDFSHVAGSAAPSPTRSGSMRASVAAKRSPRKEVKPLGMCDRCFNVLNPDGSCPMECDR